MVKAICNHSVDVWLWLHQNPDYPREAVTPLPVEIEFPWGKQIFWGNGQVYLWFRGTWGNHASQCALMALELWALERIEAGDDFSEVFRKVLEGSNSVAALGLAVKSLPCSQGQVDRARLAADHLSAHLEVGYCSLRA